MSGKCPKCETVVTILIEPIRARDETSEQDAASFLITI
jgi:hypothetical protein